MTKDLTQGSPVRLILGFALPLLAGMLFQQLYNLVDTLIVGRFLGMEALAGVGATGSINFLVLGFCMGVCSGFAIPVAQQFGAREESRMREFVANGTWLSIVFALVMTVLTVVYCGDILRVMNTPTDCFEQAYDYIVVIFAGIPFTFLYNLLSGWLRSLGDSKTPLYAMVIASILNIGLDLLFVMVFHWGIAGAVIATVIAQLFAALYCLRAVLHVKVIHLKKEYFRLNPEIAKRLLGLGTPVAAQNVIIAVGGMVVQSVVNRYGTLFVAGFTATNKLYGILEIAAVSFGYAVTTYVGQNLGAGLLDRVKKGMHSATWIALLTSVVITVFVLIFGKYGIALFISGTAEEVSISSQVAIHYLNIMSICLSILYMLHIYRSALMGLGDTIMPMASGIMEFLMRIGVALFLPLIIGQEGIFYAEVTAWTGAAILLVTMYFLRMHKLTRELDTSQSKAGE